MTPSESGRWGADGAAGLELALDTKEAGNERESVLKRQGANSLSRGDTNRPCESGLTQNSRRERQRVDGTATAPGRTRAATAAVAVPKKIQFTLAIGISRLAAESLPTRQTYMKKIAFT